MPRRPGAARPGRARSRRQVTSPSTRKAGSQPRPVMRWVVRGVLFVALAVGVFGLLPRLGGLTRDAAGLRHARPAFVAAAVVAQAVSLACYALLYRRVLASLGARLRFRLAAEVTLS